MWRNAWACGEARAPQRTEHAIQHNMFFLFKGRIASTGCLTCRLWLVLSGDQAEEKEAHETALLQERLKSRTDAQSCE